MSRWMHIGRSFCAVDRQGGLHATKARPKTRRKTYDAACGVRVRPLGFATVDGDRITATWPPYVDDAREWGFERCRSCMAVEPGKPTRPPFADGAS